MTRKANYARVRRSAALLSLLTALVSCGGEGGESSSAPAGQAAIASCAACHSFTESEPHKSGPNLWGVVGRKAGSADGYTYSAAMRESEIVWSSEELNRFLKEPSQSVPGTKMMVSTPDAELRKAIIEYLSRNDGSK